MKHKNPEVNGKDFEELVKRLSKRYVFPFSEGHLRDLAVSLEKGNNQYIKEDLEYLRKISNNHVLLTLTPNNPTQRLEERLDIIQNEVDIFDFFNAIANEQAPDLQLKCSGEQHYEINTTLMSNKNIFKDKISDNSNILDASVMIKVLEALYSNRNNPDYYKNFREIVFKIKKDIHNIDTVIDQSSSWFKNIMPFLDFLETEKDSNLTTNFINAIKAFLSINNRDFDKMTLGEKIEVAYNILDFHPGFRDKVNKKNKPFNIMRDSKNLYYASQAKYYITQDQSTLEKSSLVSASLSLNLKVLTMSDFSHKFC